MLFGVSNVGKTSIGEALAKNLNYSFYDLDIEIRRKLKITQEQFLKKYNNDHDRGQFKYNFLKQILQSSKDCVVSVSPINYVEYIQPFIDDSDILTIQLQDTPEHIFERLILQMKMILLLMMIIISSNIKITI